MTLHGSKARMAIRVTAGAAALLLAMSLTACKKQPNLTGKWAATGKTLENGEQQKGILDLKQDGNQITGEVRDLGGKTSVQGTVTGGHFELFPSGSNDKHPFIVADLTGHTIDGKEWDDHFTAKPATAADEIPTTPYIEPPALHPVPYNGLAKTPPMGWNSWNLFAEKVDDQTVRGIADAMLSSGMKEAGYIYINIDDTWEGVRDANGVLATNHKFPDMKALADYVHSKGLKIGIYSGPGPRTCGGYPASYGHEEQDAKMYAAWGIDYLKYDWCSASNIYKNEQLQPVYQKMGDALHATGRPIVFSLCEYGLGSVEKWGPAVGGNLWRTTDDIRDEWASMMDNIDKQVPTAPYAGPGPLERPRHARDRQRPHERRRVPHPHEPLGAHRRAAARRQRHPQDVRYDQVDPSQQGSDRRRSGPAGQAGIAGEERQPGDVGQAAEGWRDCRGRGQSRQLTRHRHRESQRPAAQRFSPLGPRPVGSQGRQVCQRRILRHHTRARHPHAPHPLTGLSNRVPQVPLLGPGNHDLGPGP